MNRYAFALLLCGAGFISAPVHAAEKDTSSGNYWLVQCQNSDPGRIVACINYIQGLRDGMEAQRILTKTSPIFCIPDGVTPGQLKDLFAKYLKDNPKNRHMSGDVILIHTLKQSYPCKGPG